MNGERTITKSIVRRECLENATAPLGTMRMKRLLREATARERYTTEKWIIRLEVQKEE